MFTLRCTCTVGCRHGKSLAAVQELFQLLMRELFDADFGIFTMDTVSRTYYCTTQI